MAESTYIELTGKNGKQYVIGSLYRLPNTDETTLVNHMKNTLLKLKNEPTHKEIIMGMDHNLDLLKIHQHKPTQKFLETMLDCNMLPTITHPSRITSNSATLIDNIFISKQLQKSFDSCLIMDNMSDHLPTLALLKQTHIIDESPLTFKS